MSIKLNGATSGSVELDVPAVVGSDLQLTLPTTAGEFSVKDANGNVEVTSINSVNFPNVGALSNRNFVINGAMTVAQRSTAAVTNVVSFSANIKYDAIDRWSYWASNASKFTVQQVTDAPPGFYNSLKITSSASTTHSAGDGYTISQRVEAQNLYQASLGTANAKNLVVSFWVKSTTTGTFSFYALGYGLAQSFVQNFTINSAETWEYKTINIPGPTSGNYSNTPSDYGLEIGFTLGAGSNWDTSTLGSWQNTAFQISSTTAVNVLGVATRTLQITGVQLEIGDKATSFEHRSYSDDFVNCQRYYQTINNNPTPYSNQGLSAIPLWYSANTYASTRWALPVVMRAPATTTVVGSPGNQSTTGTDGTIGVYYGNWQSTNTWTLIATETTQNSVRLNASNLPNGAIYAAAGLYFYGTSRTSSVNLDAEL